MAKVFSFEKLEAYKFARRLSVLIYKSTRSFPKHEIYGLSDQLRRASISIASNLAEGTGKHTRKEKAHYTGISFSSLMEVLCQLQIALDLNYIEQAQYAEIRELIEKLSAYLSNLRRAQLYS